MEIYKVESNLSMSMIEAKNRHEAFAEYFSYIIKNKISIDKIGSIITLVEKSGEQYAMRVAPLLYAFYVIKKDDAIANIQAIAHVSKEKAEDLLEEYVQKDREKYGKLILKKLNKEE